MDKRIQLSIVVPVYNVETYIRSCVESIYNQGLNTNNFELILINDGTQDNSFAMIADILQYPNIIIIEQPNQGLSVARNAGLEHAKGEYILFVDSDDLLLPHTIQSLISYALESMADMVIADYLDMTDEEILQNKPFEQHQGNSEKEYGSDIFLKLLEPRECYVWRTLYRKEFLVKNCISFIKGIYFEDVVFTTNCYLKANIAVRVHKIFYIYRQRSGSIVSTINKKKILDLIFNLSQLWALKENVCYSYAVRQKLSDMVYRYFSLVIWYISHNQSLLADRRELINNMLVKIPNLKFSANCKQLFTSILFRMMPSVYVWLRSFL